MHYIAAVHARYNHHACPFLAEVLYVGFFVEFDATSVAAQVAYHTVAVFLGMFLDGRADVSQACPRLCHTDTDVAAFAGHFDETFHLGTHFADHEHA